MSFLYVEMCSVSQDDNGTKLTTGGQDGHQSTYIPSATIAAIILGPGTSITQPAVVALGRAGCSVSFAGSGAVRSYGTFLSPNSPTRLLTRQAEVVSDPAQRAVAARVMFSKRFPDNGMISRSTEQMNLEALRGLEGVRMKETYRLLARRHRLSGWRRNSGTGPSMGEPDPVNLALNYANTALYGVTHCVVGLLGLSPGSGSCTPAIALASSSTSLTSTRRTSPFPWPSRQVPPAIRQSRC